MPHERCAIELGKAEISEGYPNAKVLPVPAESRSAVVYPGIQGNRQHPEVARGASSRAQRVVKPWTSALLPWWRPGWLQSRPRSRSVSP